MSIVEVLQEAEIEDQASRSDAWQCYWRLLQRAESGDPLDAAARGELLGAAKLLGRINRIKDDGRLIQRAITARNELRRIEAVDLAGEKASIDETAEVLRRELADFIAIHQPKALRLQERQAKWELDRGQRGLHTSTIERFENLINAGPDSEIANTFSI